MTSMTEQIAALDKLSTAELAAEFERLHGRPPRYRSPRWMVKRIAFQLQRPTAASAALCAPNSNASPQTSSCPTRRHAGNLTKYAAP